jgi:hypothetical protein
MGKNTRNFLSKHSRHASSPCEGQSSPRADTGAKILGISCPRLWRRKSRARRFWLAVVSITGSPYLLSESKKCAAGVLQSGSAPPFAPRRRHKVAFEGDCQRQVDWFQLVARGDSSTSREPFPGNHNGIERGAVGAVGRVHAMPNWFARSTKRAPYSLMRASCPLKPTFFGVGSSRHPSCYRRKRAEKRARQRVKVVQMLGVLLADDNSNFALSFGEFDVPTAVDLTANLSATSGHSCPVVIDCCINNAIINAKRGGSSDCLMQPRSFAGDRRILSMERIRLGLRADYATRTRRI